MTNSHDFEPLITYMQRVPAIGVRYPIEHGALPDNCWFVGFVIDIEHSLAWQVVQEFGFVLNLLSSTERLPTVFYPLSAPPYLNGGPKSYLRWQINSTNPKFTPAIIAQYLEGRLPRPVEDLKQWVPIDSDEFQEREEGNGT